MYVYLVDVIQMKIPLSNLIYSEVIVERTSRVKEANKYISSITTPFP